MFRFLKRLKQRFFKTRYIFIAMILFLISIWTIGQVFRDSCWFTGLCFYFPSPLAAIIFLLLAIFAWRKLNKTLTTLAVLAALGPVIFTVGIENKWTKDSDESENMAECRLVHWNISYNNLELKKIVDTLKKYEADIYVLSEVSAYLQATGIAEGQGGEYTTLRLGDIAIIAKDRLVAGKLISNGRGKAYPLSWSFGEIEIKLLIVDLPSNIFIERGPLLDWICNIAAELKPDLIVGDFNAPRRSLGFAGLPEGYAHAYDLAGFGWSYTWPTPLPMYAIDQCIVGPGITASDYQINTTFTSDHCLQVLSFTR